MNEKQQTPGVGLSPAVHGAVWMLIAGFCYAATGAQVRLLADDYPTFEVVFIRSVIALAMVAPVILRGGIGAFRTEQIRLHTVRAAVGYGGILCWFYGVSTIPLSNYYALQFTMPLFTIAGAVLLLSERAGFRTWVAVAVGFCGALVILRPGMVAISLGALAAIAAALAFAVANLCIRVLSRKDNAVVIVAYANLLMIPMSLVPALFDWVTPRLVDIPLLLGVGIFGTIAQFSLTRAVGLADARIIQPFDFARLPFAALIGWLVFEETTDIWTWTGAVIIFLAGYYVLSRESPRRKS